MAHTDIHIDSYKFPAKLKISLIVGMIIGVLSLAGAFMLHPDQLHTRFWSNLLHNCVFFTGIAFLATFFLAASITAWAGWYTVFKRVWESFSMFLIVGFGLMAFMALATYLDWHQMYHWAFEGIADKSNVEGYDRIIGGKSGFLNKNVYFFGTLICVGAWLFIALRMRSLSVNEGKGKDEDFKSHRKIRVWAAAFLPLAGFTSCFVIWQWIMSVDPHWYSTMFAWYTGASLFVSMIALTIMVMMYLKAQGYFQQVSTEHFHDLGKLLFAFSIFWTYLWFSQYMLIWYSNNGEETIYFRTRFDHYKVLFYANLIINFLVPFFILMRNDTKRKWGSLGVVALIVFLGHWLDVFLMIKPGVAHTAHEYSSYMSGGHGDHGHHEIGGMLAPGFIEIGTMIGFLSLFLFFVFSVLGRTALVSSHDPYIEESVHHHV